MPREEEINLHHWQTFLVEPLKLLQQRSLTFRQLGISKRGGPCTVAGDCHINSLGTVGDPKMRITTEYEAGTSVSALTTTPGGNGMTHWFPYIEKGVGECNVGYNAAIGTVALTAGMNGCSLRIYINQNLGLIKFCHDNNGQYANDADYAAKGFQHLLSINADARQRGDRQQNINNYWVAEIISPMTGIYFICRKTAHTKWTIYQSVTIGDRRERRVNGYFSTKTEIVHPFRGGQAHNRVVAVVQIPTALRA